jgi:uracil-DNA glycosylase family 4
MQQGRPFVGAAGRVLDIGFREAALIRDEVNITNVVGRQPKGDEFANHSAEDVIRGMSKLHALVDQLRPKLIVTLGNEAAWSMIPGWSGDSIYRATGITDRRGFFYEGKYGPILPTLHPSTVNYQVIPNALLLVKDFEHVYDYLHGKVQLKQWPEVVVVDSYRDLKPLWDSKYIAVDIETMYDNTAIRCIGFCGDDGIPRVVPRRKLAMALEILASGIPKIFHHAQFDVYVMQHRGIKIGGMIEDTMVQHFALFPELAGKEETGGESTRMTRKGLAFLVSWYMPGYPWWKNYEDDDDSMYVLNGRDSFATRELFRIQGREMVQEDVVGVYDHKIRLLPVALKMQRRGLPVNDTLRKRRIRQIEKRQVELERDMRHVGLEYLYERAELKLSTKNRCWCCGGGKVVAKHCWNCGGLAEKPTKKADYYPLVQTEGVHYITDVPLSELETDEQRFKRMKVVELKALLPECTWCRGTGKIVWYDFNPFSGPQMIKFLELVGIPKSLWGRKKKQANEATLTKILAWSRKGMENDAKLSS